MGYKETVMSPIKLEETYEQAYLKACEFSEKYPSGLSSEHWMPSRQGDRLRYFNETQRDTIQRATAEAQAEITWPIAKKAGIKYVVEKIQNEKVLLYFESSMKGCLPTYGEKWQAFLKEVGLLPGEGEKPV